MWATDTMYGQVKSFDGNLYAQLLSNGTYFSEINPMAKKADMGKTLKTFMMDTGVPEELMANGLQKKNIPGTELMECCRRNFISLTRTKPERPNHNPTEGLMTEV